MSVKLGLKNTVGMGTDIPPFYANNYLTNILWSTELFCHLTVK